MMFVKCFLVCIMKFKLNSCIYCVCFIKSNFIIMKKTAQFSFVYAKCFPHLSFNSLTLEVSKHKRNNFILLNIISVYYSARGFIQTSERLYHFLQCIWTGLDLTRKRKSLKRFMQFVTTLSKIIIKKWNTRQIIYDYLIKFKSSSTYISTSISEIHSNPLFIHSCTTTTKNHVYYIHYVR